MSEHHRLRSAALIAGAKSLISLVTTSPDGAARTKAVTLHGRAAHQLPR